MADINLVRIDFRLIHGQVVTKWVKQANANRIIIVNDMLAKDEFLASVYKMAAPSNVKVDICLLYTSPSPRDTERSRMPSSA